MSVQLLEDSISKIIQVSYADEVEAISLLNDIELVAKEYGYEYELLRQALYYNVVGEYKQAKSILEKSIEIAYACNNVYVIVESSLFLAYLYISWSNKELAYELLLNVLSFGENEKALNNIGDIYLNLNDFEEANKYFLRAKKKILLIYEPKRHDLRLMTVIYSNLAITQVEARNFIEARQVIKECLDIANSINDLYGLASSNNILGQIEKKVGNYDIAIELFKKADSIYNQPILMNEDMVHLYIDENLREYANALHLSHKYHKSIEIIKTIRKITSNDYALLIKNSEALNLNKDANQYYKQYLEFTTDLRKNRIAKRIQNFRAKVEIIETEKKAKKYENMYRNIKSISEIGRKIISSENLDDTIEVIYNHIESIMSFDSIGIGKVDNETNILNYNWIFENDNRQEPFTVDIEDKNRLSSWVVRHKRAIKINEALTGKEVLKYKEKHIPFNKGVVVESMIICPIILNEEVFGIITVQSTEKFLYTEYDLEVVKMFAAFIAVAMKIWDNTLSLIQANEKLEMLSKTDALTGISNRHVLTVIVEELFIMNKNEDNKLSIVMVDIDHFKEFNDTYGHIEGDKCIIDVVNELKKFLDVGDNRLFRYGGDEFVAIVPHKSIDEVNKLLENTIIGIRNLKIENKNSKVSSYVTCSFGYTTIVKDNMIDYQKAFYLADQALYVAKANGKNQVAFEAVT